MCSMAGEWRLQVLLSVLLVLLAIWLDLPGWLYDLVSQRQGIGSTYC